MIGFDLDLTLIDTKQGFGRVLEALSDELGVPLPIPELTSNLGPPLTMLLEPYLEAEAIDPAVDRFRELYPALAVEAIGLLPGAREAIDAVRRHDGVVVVVTGKFTPNAQLHLDHLDLEVDHVEGKVWGVEKGPVLRRHGARAYVGDHVHDMEGARAAGVLGVGVLTGPCSERELVAAGADVVLPSLVEFPDWLDAHLT